MFSSLIKATFGISALLISTASVANSVDFSAGTGYPFFGQIELSLPQADSNSRWYGNYLIGLDDGFSVGYEKAVSDNNKHAIGVVLGALGARDAGPVCEDDDNITCGIFEPIIDLFDSETTNGIGVSYSYYFTSINQPGWRVKLVAGYGESDRHNVDRADGSLIFSYQF
ncbi:MULTISPECIES: hypothetical protein [Pseudoalteromonas]|uniref:Outer membrane protein beta-barrel domain-containing protein n=1 Tax=Pseudoalteromonas piscicida TaxID=43662 RepID=A0AAQ2ET69_PSEO7|nr:MULTISPECIES: hypothetical protein [Pseudoalteromonas]ATD09916.1 hypothetical protein PPIS_b0840 [Pseudoalteromonas piscicida]KJY87742.1 hypothetical protein TW75_14430 [Pseudoalteromonas piscicida]MCO7199561.1 hypothetical protein [Pseudoalteromonas sp. OANN1]TMN35300.1 hypothetical protein CWB95_19085 [Pseudoalteromonas piscicida]TMN39151.1 hypothetical protein CWB94_11930 [Pseudoalteromonas piscicida]